MIHLQNVSKVYPFRHKPRTVLDTINLQINRGQKIGILGRNGAGKSTLIRLISGAERATSGVIKREMSVSWPLAFSDAFQGNQSGLDVLRFLCRIYNVDIKGKVEFVQDFTELGGYLREPTKTYSSGMRARLAFAVSMAIDFDCFLIDEVVAVGDKRFHERCHYELFEKRGDRAFIIVSHNPDFVKNNCDTAAVLLDGKLHSYDKIDEAFAFYESTVNFTLAREEVIWAYRFILGRDPENENAIQSKRQLNTFETLRGMMFNSKEFLLKQEKGFVRNTVPADTLLSREEVIMGCRLLLGKIPESEEEIEKYRLEGTIQNLRATLLNSEHFQRQKNISNLFV